MEGQTPFMQAVSQRAYPAAKLLLDAALKLMSRNSQSGADSSALMDMLYPSGSAPDANPLHVLCCNDTCSFTWTGNEHINQVIFFQTLITDYTFPACVMLAVLLFVTS
jgi:E3 ubiquitin-protein ligase EDD1